MWGASGEPLSSRPPSHVLPSPEAWTLQLPSLARSLGSTGHFHPHFADEKIKAQGDRSEFPQGSPDPRSRTSVGCSGGWELVSQWPSGGGVGGGSLVPSRLTAGVNIGKVT